MSNINTNLLELPDYAKDLTLNLSSLLRNESLNKEQLLGCFLTAGYTTKNTALIQWLAQEVEPTLDANVIKGAKAAASIMGMNNIYYRFTHLVSDTSFRAIPAGLRMQIMANSGVSKVDFELYSLVSSAINGCGMCMDAHTAQLLKHELSKEQIATSIRIAAVMSGIAQTLTIENN